MYFRAILEVKSSKQVSLTGQKSRCHHCLSTLPGSLLDTQRRIHFLPFPAPGSHPHSLALSCTAHANNTQCALSALLPSPDSYTELSVTSSFFHGYRPSWRQWVHLKTQCNRPFLIYIQPWLSPVLTKPDMHRFWRLRCWHLQRQHPFAHPRSYIWTVPELKNLISKTHSYRYGIMHIWHPPTHVPTDRYTWEAFSWVRTLSPTSLFSWAST